MARVADTSAIYALFNEADARHGEALAAFKDIETILVPSEILVEAIDLIGRRIGRVAAGKSLSQLLSTPQVRIAERVHIEAVESTFREAAGKLSLADCFVVETCRAIAAEPIAYDRDILETLGAGRRN